MNESCTATLIAWAIVTLIGGWVLMLICGATGAAVGFWPAVGIFMGVRFLVGAILPSG